MLFALQNAPKHNAALAADLAMSPLAAESGSVKFDLSMVIEEGERGLAVALRYNVDLFDQATAARLLNCFAVLLEAIVAAPQQPISQLALLRPAEWAQLLAQGNETAPPFPIARQCTVCLKRRWSARRRRWRWCLASSS